MVRFVEGLQEQVETGVIYFRGQGRLSHRGVEGELLLE